MKLVQEDWLPLGWYLLLPPTEEQIEELFRARRHWSAAQAGA